QRRQHARPGGDVGGGHAQLLKIEWSEGVEVSKGLRFDDARQGEDQQQDDPAVRVTLRLPCRRVTLLVRAGRFKCHEVLSLSAVYPIRCDGRIQLYSNLQIESYRIGIAAPTERIRRALPYIAAGIVTASGTGREPARGKGSGRHVLSQV